MEKIISSPRKKPTTLYLQEELFTLTKEYSAEQRVRFSTTVALALEEYFAKRKPKTKNGVRFAHNRPLDDLEIAQFASTTRKDAKLTRVSGDIGTLQLVSRGRFQAAGIQND